MKFNFKPYSPAFIHAIIWLVLLAVPTLLVSDEPRFGLTKSFYIITTIFHIGIFYLNAFFLFPRLMNKRWWWLYIISLAAIIFLSYPIKVFFLQLSPGFAVTHVNQRIIGFGVIPFLIASFLFRLIYDRVVYQKKVSDMKAEQLASELKFLRSQISPHFLFNMLTNMVALARAKSDLLEPSLIRLSELLRYMLYESEQEKIPVRDEIQHIENYISLQLLRFGDAVRIEKNFQIDCDNCLIEPLLLIPFIENAFKHGIGLQPDPYLKISLQVTPGQLSFFVENNYVNENNSKDKASGIGLQNVKNRLELMYPRKNKLDIQNSGNIFMVHLKIDLS